MKKKIIFGITICLFAIVTLLNISIFSQSGLYNLTLNYIEAKAEDPIEQITPINYDPYHYPITGSWCCFSGTKGCIPYNCPE
jgi:hypothetical protein